MLNNLNSTIILGSSLQSWAIALTVFFVTFFALKIFKASILGKLKKLSTKTDTELDDMLVDAIRAIHSPFYVFTSIYVSTFFVVLNSVVQKIIYYVFLISIVYYIIKFLEKLVDYGTKKLISQKDKDGNEGIIKLGGGVVKIALWCFAVMSVLANMGYDVTSLIAGLGIGGIAVALALQNILGDLFSSFTIMMDKPFKIGDFIVLGTQSGTVKKIGIKSTRIELLQGEELVVSNSELTKSQIQNFGTMEKRRISFNLGIVYGTPPDLLEKIPNIIQKIIESEELTDFNRAKFTAFGDFSLNFSVVYYVNSPNYADSLGILERINLNIIREFDKEGIEMAFPTQTLHIEK